MRVLAIDIGSSSVKSAVVQDGKLLGRVARVAFPTSYTDVRAEVDIRLIEQAVGRAIRSLDAARTRRVEAIAMASMGPSWLAMSRTGRALCPVITHQDRRSIAQAQQIEQRVGKARHLKITGVRPVAGAISSTTFLWMLQHHGAIIRKADLFGHLSTYFIRRWTGQRVIDPGHATFMGVYQTFSGAAWSGEMCDAIGLSQNQLPEIRFSGESAGRLSATMAAELGLPGGLPMLSGCIDTTAAMCHTGARVGQVLNVCGSSDVLALCTDRPRVDPRLIVRAMGIPRRWLVVSTLAASGSVLNWLGRELFSDWPASRFWKEVHRLGRAKPLSDVVFDPHLAGDRMSVEQHFGSIENLRLSSTRAQILQSAIFALRDASRARVKLLQAQPTRILSEIAVSGGAEAMISSQIRSLWGRSTRIRFIPDATLVGLSEL